MTTYVTNMNTKVGTTYVDIGTLFCDNSHNQTLSGDKTFLGIVNAPTASSDASNTQVINAAWIYDKQYAPINSPTFTGTPRAPTPATDASMTELVNAAWVNSKSSIAYGFAAPVFFTFLGYPASNAATTVMESLNSTTPKTFGYGIYICCMQGGTNTSDKSNRLATNVEVVRLVEDGGQDGDASRLTGEIGNGSITYLHFRPHPDNRQQIQIWGNYGYNLQIKLWFYRLF
jgi:hypothetical protein